jgi:hypothetical protein
VSEVKTTVHDSRMMTTNDTIPTTATVTTTTTPSTATTIAVPSSIFRNNKNGNHTNTISQQQQQRHRRNKMGWPCTMFTMLVTCILVCLLWNVTLLTRRKPSLWAEDLGAGGGGGGGGDLLFGGDMPSNSTWYDSTIGSEEKNSRSRTIRATHTFDPPPPLAISMASEASLSHSFPSSTSTSKTTTTTAPTTRTSSSTTSTFTATTTTTKTTPTPTHPLPIPEISFCLLIKDDNDILNEWIAYHYHVMNLRRMIVAVDPTSETTPQALLQVWGDAFHLNYTIWKDGDYMPRPFVRGDYADVPKFVKKEIKPHPEDPLGDRGTMITTIWHSRDKSANHTQEQIKYDIQMTNNHRYRQAVFVSQCYKQLQREGRTWTVHIDTDEYIVVNPYIRHRLKDYTNDSTTSTKEEEEDKKKKMGHDDAVLGEPNNEKTTNSKRIVERNVNRNYVDVDVEVVNDILLNDTGSKPLKEYIDTKRSKKHHDTNNDLKKTTTMTNTTTKTVPSHLDLPMVVPTLPTQGSLVTYWQKMTQMYPPFKESRVDMQHLSSRTCIIMPTLLFGPREDDDHDSTTKNEGDVSHRSNIAWNATNFETIRWRYHGGLPARTNGFPKTMLNVQPIPTNHWIYRVGRVSNIHQPLPSAGNMNGVDRAYCPGNIALWYPKDAHHTTPYNMPFQQAALYRPLAIQHYLGSLDRYLFRTDIRRNQLMFEERARNVNKIRVGTDEESWMTSWPTNFVETYGIDKAMKVLKDYIIA